LKIIEIENSKRKKLTAKRKPIAVKKKEVIEEVTLVVEIRRKKEREKIKTIIENQNPF
jgi:DNA mismatch repair protein MutS2